MNRMTEARFQRRISTRCWSIIAGVISSLVMLVGGCSQPPEVPIQQAIWVTRWDYKTQDDVEQCIQNVADGGFDTVIFQVRGNGTVFYRSQLEPWAEEFDHTDPGFDPLAIACQEAARHGLAIHAWINAVPGWRGDTPPPVTTPPQHWNAHPDWFLHDSQQKRQPLQPNYYVALNPCLPTVRKHVADICSEIVEKYPVAGIHLDYIRFLESGVEIDYPRDPQSLARFTRQTGVADPEQDSEAWDRWRRDQVTEMVREIRVAVKLADRRALLTAAVYRTPEIAYQRVRQDWPRWLRLGLIDAVFPMQYDREVPRFEERVQECLHQARGYPVLMGLGTYLHPDPEVTLQQQKLALRLGCQGICHFAYSSFYSTHSTSVAEESLRKVRRSRILGTS